MVKQSSLVSVVTTLSFAVLGTLEAGVDQTPTLIVPCDLTIMKTKLVVKTAPTGSDLIVDVNIGGVTIYTTQVNRPIVLDGNTQGDSGVPDVTTLSEGDKMTIDIDQTGSSVAGENLTVELLCLQPVKI